ncbi:Translation elongation/initiation factor/Ribosomal beta-barrel [Penicillium samsonianum]|uniref:Translation elongation/initiation factor/Ribosomal beta-barrel n=1 Tax=Penicillium samsonianum TaxID=1882272 RepID=UPI002548F561|nr:Translation elongation/initiation factor/Ribosomal beta-barrel [Penicillium samsonianum]KAJ6139077.1 Translation elongation/initiation factor/Ribosomal beta-barrel [Penicillium samsonianum]
MTNFIGAGIISVHPTLTEKFGVEIQDVSYLTSIHMSHTIFLKGPACYLVALEITKLEGDEEAGESKTVFYS